MTCKYLAGLLAAAAVVGAHCAGAQTVGDEGDYSNSNLFINAQSVDHTGDYYIGDEGTNNYLEISNDGSLYISGHINMGSAVGSDHNEVLITGAGSSLTNTGVLRMGRGGSYNTWRIEDGGRAYIRNPTHLGGEDGSSHNTMIVDDGELQTARLILGVGSSGTTADHNLMVITNGGVADVDLDGYGSGYVIVGWSHGSGEGTTSSNRLVITGTDSRLTTTNYLSVGHASRAHHNSVLVQDGGLLQVQGSDDSYIGRGGATHNELRIDGGEAQFADRFFVGSGSGSDNNLVVVENDGILAVDTNIYVGSGGFSNTLTVSDGIVSANALYFGNGSDYNVVLVGEDGLLQAQGSGYSHVGRSGGAHNELRIDGGEAHFADRLYVGQDGGGEHNLVLLENGGVLEVDARTIFGGAGQASNRLVVSSGSRAQFAENLYLFGDYPSLDVSGGSELDVSSRLYFGRSAFHSTMDVSGASTVTVGTALYVGDNQGASNTLTVTDSTVSANNLFIGNEANHNIMNISGGSTVASDNYIYVGEDGGQSNTLTVSGSGTALSSILGLTVGNNSDHNTMTLSGGATYENSDENTDWTLFDYLGRGGNSNRLVITDPGTRWTAGNRFYVGQDGGLYNTLVISNEAVMDVTVNHFHLGSGYSNRLIVTDGGMLDISGGGLLILSSDSDDHGNTMIFENGGILTNHIDGGQFRFGSGETSAENLMVFDGSETRGYWHGNLRMGYNEDSGNNTLRVQDGAEVYLEELRLNSASNAGNNRIVIEGGGSLLEASSSLEIGHNEYATGASLTVSNGGHFLHTGSRAYLGYESDETEILVTGPGSLLEATNSATFAHNSRHNTMTVSDGGRVEVDGQFGMGASSGADSNTLVITGEDSLLQTRGSPLNIMHHGSYNTFRVENGGMWTNIKEAYTQRINIADGSGSHNRFIVDDAEVYLPASHSLYIGAGGYDNQIVVTNGGYLSAPVVNISFWSGEGSNNAMIVSGPGSSAEIASIRPGRDGSHNFVAVNDGASIESRDVIIGQDAAGIYDPTHNGIIVDGMFTTWDNSRDVYVGDGGSASYLTVSGGGLLTNAGGWGQYIGYQEHSQANTARVTGAWSRWHTASPLYVGYSGTVNRLIVDSEGQLGTPDAYIGYGAASSGNEALVTGSGSEWQAFGDIAVSLNEAAGNRLTVADGGAVHADSLQVYSGGTVALSNGYIQADIQVHSGGVLEGGGPGGLIMGSVTSDGVIAPGFSTGTLELIGGGFTLQENSEVLMELAGDEDYDRLLMDGAMVFDGAITVSLLGGYLPEDGDSFLLFDASSYSGKFSAYNMPDLGEGLGWDRSTLEQDGTLTVIPEPSTGILLAVILGLLALRGKTSRG